MVNPVMLCVFNSYVFNLTLTAVSRESRTPLLLSVHVMMVQTSRSTFTCLLKTVWLLLFVKATISRTPF